MNKTNNKQKNRRLYLISTLVVILLLILTFAFLYKNDYLKLSGSEVKADTQIDKAPKFKLASVSGWWQGATNQSSMAVFQKDSHDCFVSAEEHSGSVDISNAVDDYSSLLKKQGYKLSAPIQQKMSLQTSNGQEEYTLYKFTADTPKKHLQVKAGQELGYINFDDSYVKIIGNCDEYNQLPETDAALNAIHFRNS